MEALPLEGPSLAVPMGAISPEGSFCVLQPAVQLKAHGAFGAEGEAAFAQVTPRAVLLLFSSLLLTQAVTIPPAPKLPTGAGHRSGLTSIGFCFNQGRRFPS